MSEENIVPVETTFKCHLSIIAPVEPQQQLYSYSCSSPCWDSLYSSTKHTADRYATGATCSLHWLKQTNLIVYEACVWLLATVMPVRTERPFVIPSDIQVPAMCVDIMNSFCFLFFYSVFGFGGVTCLRESQHICNPGISLVQSGSWIFTCGPSTTRNSDYKSIFAHALTQTQNLVVQIADVHIFHQTTGQNSAR